MVTTGAVSLWAVCLPPGLRTPLLIAALLIANLPLAFAGAGSYAGKPIRQIRFEPAQQPLPIEEVRRRLGLKTGEPLRMSEIQQAIQNLYATGRYSDISVNASSFGGGVALTFITTLQYFIGDVSVQGAPDPPSRGQLVTETKLQLGAPYSPDDFREATRNIAARLRDNGLYFARIFPHTGTDTRFQQMNVDYSVDAGRRARFGGLVVEGTPDLSTLSILHATGWRRPFGLGWRPLTENRLEDGLENVRLYYQKQGRLLARVTLGGLHTVEKSDRVIPALKIDPGPLVKVTTEGVSLSPHKLRQLLPIYQERSIDRSLLLEGQRNLVEYFQSLGYFDAKVSYDYDPNAAGEQLITYDIHRGIRHKLVALTITGNHYFDTSTLRERMYLVPASFPRYPNGRYSQRYLEKDVAAIEALYRSNGFRDVRVKSRTEDDYKGRRSDLAVFLAIVEGPQWLVSKLAIDGVSDADRTYFSTIIHSTPGQPYSEYNVGTDRDTILNYYFNNGYPDATFAWDQTDGPGPHQMELSYTVTPGKREYVRDVVIDGLQETDPSLVRERIDFKPGDPLSQARIAESQRRLYDLGIFAKVQTAIQNPEGDEDRKYILYDMEEARRYSFNAAIGAEIARIGGGVTTFDAPAGATGFAPRISLGVSRLNFLGLGHTVSLQSRFSTLEQRVVASYFAPQFQSHDNLNLTFTTLLDDSRDVRTFASRRVEGSIQLGQRLNKADTMQYRFTYRDVFVDPNSVKITPELIPILSQSVRVGLLSATFIQDRRDDPLDAHEGVYNTIDVGLAAKAFGSETDFARVLFRDATYHRLTRDLTFARMTTFGMMERLGGLSDIPLPERFFSGGSSSDRAFPDNQAGPRDLITGFPLGGTALLFNTFELRFPLIGDNISGVLFHDAGNVYSSVGDISFRFRQQNLQDFNYMVHAFGFGIRYRTPIGPIRIDLAFSPDSPRFYGFTGTRDQLYTCSAPGSTTPCTSVNQRINQFQFHFSLGQAF
jgi:outer membrane protein insertion porin family